MTVVDLLKRVAEKKQATPAQIALAWLLAQKPWIVPIPGTRNIDHLEENLGAINVHLTSADLREIDTYARLVILLIIERLEAADGTSGFFDSNAEDRSAVRHHQTERVEDIAISDAPRSGVPNAHLNRCNALRVHWLALVNEPEFSIEIWVGHVHG